MLQGTDLAFGTNKPLTFTTIYVKQDLTHLSDVGQWTKVVQAAADTYTDSTSAEQEVLWAIDFTQDDLDIANDYNCLRAAVGDVGSVAQLGTVLYIAYDPIQAKAPENMAAVVTGGL